MHPVQGSETIRVLHEQMIRDELRRQRPALEGHQSPFLAGLRSIAARILGHRIEPASHPVETATVMSAAAVSLVPSPRDGTAVDISSPGPDDRRSRPAA